MTTHEQALLVKRLRELTGLGLMECKYWLKENDWDIDKATKAAIQYSRAGKKDFEW